MARYNWSQYPTQWIKDPQGLRDNFCGLPGTDAAALKVLITVAGRAGLPKSLDGFTPGSTKITYDELEDVTGLSRAMISRGVRHLVDRKLITVSDDGKGNVYNLSNFNLVPGWGKLPYTHLQVAAGGSKCRLAGISHRGRTGRDALKVYLALITFRDNLSGYSRLSYDRITHYTGIERRHIRAALSVLFESGVVHRERLTDAEDSFQLSHLYLVNGVTTRRPTLPASGAATAADFELPAS